MNVTKLIFLLTIQWPFNSSTDNREESDNEDWEARENSRTHSVKFSEDSNADKETLFVRQNTPHPKELKAKAHKLFSKDKKDDDTIREEVSSNFVNFPTARWHFMRLRYMLRNFNCSLFFSVTSHRCFFAQRNGWLADRQHFTSPPWTSNSCAYRTSKRCRRIAQRRKCESK